MVGLLGAARYDLLTPLDGVMFVLWLTVIVTVALMIRKSRYRNDPAGRYLLPGLLVKIFGGVMVGLVYQFYYKGGDTTGYFLNSSALLQIFLENFGDGVQMYFVDFHDLSYEDTALFQKYYNSGKFLVYWSDTNSYNVSRYIIWANALSLDTYYGTAILLASFSFVGVWALYRVFTIQYPEIAGRLAIAILFIPSVFFWGSGILKDSLTLSTSGLLVYGCFWLLRSGYRSLWAYLLIISSGFLIYQIKPYVMFSLTPFLAIWLGLTIRQQLRSGLIRFSIVPLILVVVAGVGYLALTVAGTSSQRYSADRILSSAVEIKNDLTSGYYYSDQRGSSYDIGEFDESFLSQFRLFIPAVVTTYFRPFIWEVRNVMMFFASIESTAVLLLFLSLLFRTGIFNLIILTARNPFLLMCIGYSIFFGYIVGLTSGNFGNLVRFKTPSLPFFLAGLFIAEYIVRLYRQRNLVRPVREARLRPMER